MKKKIFIGVAVFIILLLIAFVYLNYRNRTLSPKGEVSYSKGDLTIDLSYSRPSVRGRLIFGSGTDGALLPYGEYWRLGANEATEITFSQDVLFNGVPIDAGTYKMYAVPGPEEFEISLNSELGNWGYSEPDYSLDVAKTKVKAETGPAVEQFTFRIEEEGSTVLVIFEWSDTRVKIPVESR